MGLYCNFKKPKITPKEPSERREMTDTFRAELQRRVGGSSGSREFVLPTKTSTRYTL